MRERLEEDLRGAGGRLLEDVGDTGDPPAFTIEASRQQEHGDFACNAAMVLASRLRRPPREIAARLPECLGDAGGLVGRAEIAGPGFVNLWLSGDRWRAGIRALARARSNPSASASTSTRTRCPSTRRGRSRRRWRTFEPSSWCSIPRGPSGCA